MKKKWISLLWGLTAACLLCGCSWLDKEYGSIHDYVVSEQEQHTTNGRVTVHSFNALTTALLGMAYEGMTEGSIVFDPAYDGDAGEDMERAIRTPDGNLAIEAEHLICRTFRKAQDEEVKGLAALAMVKLREYLAQLQGNVKVVCGKQ